jgi:homospermidine synthase
VLNVWWCFLSRLTLAFQKTYETLAVVEAPQNLVILGLGAIGRGVLPMILRHIKIDVSQIIVCSARDVEREIAEEYGVKWVKTVLDRDNYRALLTPHIKAGDVFLNLSSCVSSIDVIHLCQELNVTYIDSSNETWDDSPDELHQTWGRYIAKERALKKVPGTPTALMSHGANPGMVNHFVKHAMLVC